MGRHGSISRWRSPLRTGYLPVVGLLAVAALLASGCARTVEREGGEADRRGAVGTVGPGPDTPNGLVANSQLSQLPAFVDVPWADDLKAEQDEFDGTGRTEESPYGEYAMPDFAGKYTNVTNSERLTLDTTCRCATRNVWIFGASSAFGLGQRDDYTVASYLDRRGTADGVDLKVRNLSVPGHTFYDEAGGLESHLALDPVLPDVVVFLDGFNDVLASYMYGVLNRGSTLDPIRFDDDWTNEFLSQTRPDLASEHIDPIAGHVAREYLDLSDGILALLEEHSIPVFFFFQPDGFVSPIQSEGLALSLNRGMAELSQSTSLSLMLREVAGRLGDRVIDLRGPVAALEEPIFADATHFNEVGAEFIAGLIYGNIRQAIRD